MEQQYIILIVRTILFFSKCDNDYDDREKLFVERYIKSLERNNCLEQSTKQLLANADNEQFTIQEIVAQTKDFLSKIDPKEVPSAIEELEKFIDLIINADGVLAKEEVENFNIWKSEIKG